MFPTIIAFLAILLTALASTPSAAHALALLNKLRLPRERYFAARQIYRGRAPVGIAPVAAMAADLYLDYRLRDRPVAFLLSLAGGSRLAATLAVFFIWIWPANQSTDNWLSTTSDWATQRAR